MKKDSPYFPKQLLSLCFLIVLFLSFSSCKFLEEPFEEKDNCDWDPVSCYNKSPLWRSELLLHFDPKEPYVSTHRLTLNPTYDGVVMAGYSDATGRSYVGLDVRTGKRVWTGKYKTGRGNLNTSGQMVQDGRYLYFYDIEYFYLDPPPKEEGAFRFRTEEALFKWDISGGGLVSRKLFPRLAGQIVDHTSLGGFMVVSGNPYPGRVELRVHRLDDIENPYEIPPPPLVDAAKNLESGVSYTLAEEGGEVYVVYAIWETPYTLLDGENLSVTDRYKFDYDKQVAHLSCYNLTQKRWLYLHKPCKGRGRSTKMYRDMVIFGNAGYSDNAQDLKIYPPGIWAYNWKTGEEVWETLATDLHSVPGFPFSPSNLTHHNGVLVFGSISYAYGLDIRTGKMKWKREGIGNSASPFLFHRGVVYGVGAYLNGWDLHNGETLMYAKCPDAGAPVPAGSSGKKLGGFLGNIGMYVDPETGDAIIVTRNEYYMYGYKAVR